MDSQDEGSLNVWSQLEESGVGTQPAPVNPEKVSAPIPDPLLPAILEVDLRDFRIAQNKHLEQCALGACLEDRGRADYVLGALDADDFKDPDCRAVFQILLKCRAQRQDLYIDGERLGELISQYGSEISSEDGSHFAKLWTQAFKREGGDATAVITRLREVGKMRGMQRIFQRAMVKAGKKMEYRELREWMDCEMQPYLERSGDDPRRRFGYWDIRSLRVSEKTVYAWEGLLAVGAVSMLHAPPKAGKSYLTFALLHAILKGQAFLERQTVKTGAVMLTEEGRQTLREKCDRFHIDDGLPFYFLSRRDPELASLSFKDAVKAGLGVAQERKCGMLVIDTLAAWSGMQQDEENQAAKIENLFSWLRAQATAAGVSMLILHHTAKYGTTARGSTALEGACDSILRLYTPIEGHTRRVLIPKSRFAETPGKIEFELGPQGFTTQLSDGENYEDVWKVLPEELPGMTALQLAEKVNLSKRHVQDTLRKMVHRNMAQQHGRGDKHEPLKYTRILSSDGNKDPGVSEASQNA